MEKIILGTLSILLVAISSSCDPVIKVKKRVNNLSSYDIRFVMSDSTIVMVPSHSTIELGEEQDYANRLSDNYQCDNALSVGWFDYPLAIQGGDTTVITNTLTNWSFSKFEKRKGECVLIISDSDIE